MDKPRLHSGLIEIAVVGLLDYRVHDIVPNVSYGWGLRHEADIIAVNKNGYVTEVEIKISASDLKADFKKGHSHESKKIHSLVYAVPDSLVPLCIELIPPHAGIISVRFVQNYSVYKTEHKKGIWVANWIRKAKKNRNPAITEKQRYELLRLASMRIWSLKKHNYNG